VINVLPEDITHVVNYGSSDVLVNLRAV
jgi:hypothetical protein